MKRPWIMMKVPYEVGETIRILNEFQQPLTHGKIISTYQKIQGRHKENTKSHATKVESMRL
jgi:hypothetical protein